MLCSPTVEELQALHLHGLLTAWEEQERHPEAAELPFAERLRLLIDAVPRKSSIAWPPL